MNTTYASRVCAAIAGVVLLAPTLSYAFPFGGMIGQIIFCYNNAIYAAVGPPVGGPMIWTPSTKTYQFGPPSHVGQWLLGLAAPPYYCLVSVQPVIVWAGTLMTMEGSSGPSAPGSPGGLGGNLAGGGNSGAGSIPGSIGGGFGNAVGDLGGSGATPNGGTGTGGVGHLLVSEVYYQADTAHGGKIENQWIEIYNPTLTPVELSGWSLQTKSSTQFIPSGTTVGANGYVVFAGSSDVRSLWNIRASTPVIVFTTSFAGFSANGDHVYLRHPGGTQIDAVSYASDTTAFSPSVPSVVLGRSILRKSFVSDSNTAADWVETSDPNPGR